MESSSEKAQLSLGPGHEGAGGGVRTISNSVFPDVKLEETPGGGETGCKTTASLRSLDVT